MSILNGPWVDGTATVAQASEEATILAAQGAGKRIYIQHLAVTVLLAATGGTGEVAVEDGSGGTRLFEADADAVGVYHVDFGQPGFPLTPNTLLNLTVDGAGTNEATARATFTGMVS